MYVCTALGLPGLLCAHLPLIGHVHSPQWLPPHAQPWHLSRARTQRSTLLMGISVVPALKAYPSGGISVVPALKVHSFDGHLSRARTQSLPFWGHLSRARTQGPLF